MNTLYPYGVLSTRDLDLLTQTAAVVTRRAHFTGFFSVGRLRVLPSQQAEAGTERTGGPTFINSS